MIYDNYSSSPVLRSHLPSMHQTHDTLSQCVSVCPCPPSHLGMGTQLWPPRHLSNSMSPIEGHCRGFSFSLSFSLLVNLCTTIQHFPYFIMSITTGTINMQPYNNVIYGDVNINIDLCAVRQADLLSCGMPMHAEVAGVLIEYQSLLANRHTLTSDQTLTDQHIKRTKRLTPMVSLSTQVITKNHCLYWGVLHRFFFVVVVVNLPCL